MRARVEGRAKTAERTAWTLNANGLNIRCLATPGGYVVQARVDKWVDLGLVGEDPLVLLQAVTSTRTVREALQALREAGR